MLFVIYKLILCTDYSSGAKANLYQAMAQFIVLLELALRKGLASMKVESLKVFGHATSVDC